MLARWAPFSPRARRRGGGDARNLDASVRCCCCYGGVGAMFEAAPPFGVFVVPPPAGWVRRGMAAEAVARSSSERLRVVSRGGIVRRRAAARLNGVGRRRL